MYYNSPEKSAEQVKQQKNVSLSAKHLLSHTHAKYRIFSNLIRTFLQFQGAKKSDADLIRGRELYVGKLIEPLCVP